MARILIVDDSIVMRKNLQVILTEGGHEIVGQAVNGKQAVILYSELRPDLVTMDISMPLMTGVDAVSHIINKDPIAKIIMISALNQKQMVFEALNNGAKHYIIKPIDPGILLTVINDVLSNGEEDTQGFPILNLQVKQGFEIENINGIFIINFNEDLGIKDHITLETAVKGLLFIRPLNMIFNFDVNNEPRVEILLPIIRMANNVRDAGGSIEFKAKNEIVLEKINGVVK